MPQDMLVTDTSMIMMKIAKLFFVIVISVHVKLKVKRLICFVIVGIVQCNKCMDC